MYEPSATATKKTEPAPRSARPLQPALHRSFDRGVKQTALAHPVVVEDAVEILLASVADQYD